MSRTVRLVHNRVSLALHHLRDGDGRPLLVLHGLGERSPATVPAWAAAWDGPVAALDFTGHGESTIPRGGGYTSEILLADAPEEALNYVRELPESDLLALGRRARTRVLAGHTTAHRAAELETYIRDLQP